MTVYQNGLPADGRTGGGADAASMLRGVIFSVTAVASAFGAMGVVGALGVHLLGLDKYASLGPLTAALVAMAVGGKVSPTGDVSVFGIDAAAAQGSIGIMPLGLTVVGAVVLGWLFTVQLRRVAVLTVADLMARAAGAVVAFLVLLAVIGWAGSGSVAVNVSSLTGGGSSGSGSGGSGDDPLGGLGNLIGGALGDNTKPTVGFTTDLAPTLGMGLLWVVLVLAFAYLAARRAPLPAAWRGLARTVRPVASAITTVYVGAVTVGALAGAVVGLTGNGGAKTIGGALLGAPNGVFLAVPLGMGVSMDGKASGPLAHFLPAPIDTFLAGGQGKTITVSSLASLDGRVWLLPVAVVLMLIAVGVLAAVRTPRPAAGTESAAQELGGAGVRLGVALLVVTPMLLALADVKVDANLSVFGFDAVGAGLSVTGNVLLALVLGLVEGVVFGAVGAALVRAFAGAKRVSLAKADGTGVQAPAVPPGAPSGAPSGMPPSGPAVAPPAGSQAGGVYGGLPATPPQRSGPPPAHNPYAAPPVPPPAAPPAPQPVAPPAPDPYGGLPQSPQAPQPPYPGGPRPQDPPGGNPYR